MRGRAIATQERRQQAAHAMRRSAHLTEGKEPNGEPKEPDHHIWLGSFAPLKHVDLNAPRV